MTESKHRRAFEEFAELAKRELGNSLKHLVLYGSVAQEEEDGESDVDVFAVVENQEQKEWLEKQGALIGVEHGVLLVPVVKTVEEYREMKDTVYGREVMETGEVHV